MNWGLIGGGAQNQGRKPDILALAYPSAEDGLQSIVALHAAVESARAKGASVELPGRAD